MTREEATKWLKLLHTSPLIYGEQLEALDMAIEALQAKGGDAEMNEVKSPYMQHNPNGATHGRLIDADALIKAFEGCMPLSEDTIIRTIRTAPTVSADRPHGEWIRRDNYKVMGEGYIWHCSICDEKVYQDSSRDYPHNNFCPNCGADNRKENK